MTLYDCKATKNVFNFSKLDSILEHKEILKGKIELTENKVKEELMMN